MSIRVSPTTTIRPRSRVSSTASSSGSVDGAEAAPRGGGTPRVGGQGAPRGGVGRPPPPPRPGAAGGEPVAPAARPEHAAGGGVADRLERGEPVPGGSQGHGDALRARLLDDLL